MRDWPWAPGSVFPELPFFHSREFQFHNIFYVTPFPSQILATQQFKDIYLIDETSKYGLSEDRICEWWDYSEMTEMVCLISDKQLT